jgi:hypothetical protein
VLAIRRPRGRSRSGAVDAPEGGGDRDDMTHIE